MRADEQLRSSDWAVRLEPAEHAVLELCWRYLMSLGVNRPRNFPDHNVGRIMRPDFIRVIERNIAVTESVDE